jgi:predicted tellurium resistance membrane protein TerC
LLIFAVDSVPAIFGEPRPVHRRHLERFCHPGTSLSLLSTGGHHDPFIYLDTGPVLGFVGVKMLLVDIYKIPSACRSPWWREY